MNSVFLLLPLHQAKRGDASPFSESSSSLPLTSRSNFGHIAKYTDLYTDLGGSAYAFSFTGSRTYH